MIGPLAVSNLAWPAEALDEALALLSRSGCGGVEIAPFAVFGRWDGIADDAKRLRDRVQAHGLECVALQGILYGAEDVSLFGTAGQQARLEHHLDHVAGLARILGARACVFGAPSQRDPGDIGASEAWDRALGGLRRLAPAFEAIGSAIAFEANAAHYGCRFITTTAEAARFVEAANTPGIRLQIDTGTMFLEHEDPATLLDIGNIAVHLHISEPDLQVVGDHGLDHIPIASVLMQSDYAGPISVEMRAAPDWRAAIRRSLAFVQDAYL
jgi:sugar phosphate isomerase/epimerase